MKIDGENIRKRLEYWVHYIYNEIVLVLSESRLRAQIGHQSFEMALNNWNMRGWIHFALIRCNYVDSIWDNRCVFVQISAISSTLSTNRIYVLRSHTHHFSGGLTWSGIFDMVVYVSLLSTFTFIFILWSVWYFSEFASARVCVFSCEFVIMSFTVLSKWDIPTNPIHHCFFLIL